MENRSYSDIIGKDSAPYLNQLAATYGLATNYYAISHPSEPNYIALTSGDTQGIHDDEFHDVNAPNLFSQLSAAALPWRAYEQGYPGGCYTGEFANGQADGPGGVGTYSRKHDPAIMYTSISGDPSQCANIQPLSAFDPASAAFTFITPNQQNDMHDGSVQQGDDFLRSFVPQIVGSPAFSDGGLLFITFDEGKGQGGKQGDAGGQVPTLIIRPGIAKGYRTGAYYDHYSLLRTVEDAFGLPCLGSACSRDPIAY